MYSDQINRLQLPGHLHRKEETSWMKKIVNFVEDGPTSLGRPELRWKDVVNSGLRKKCWSLTLEKCYQTSDAADWTSTHSEWNTDMKYMKWKRIRLVGKYLRQIIERTNVFSKIYNILGFKNFLYLLYSTQCIFFSLCLFISMYYFIILFMFDTRE